MFKRKEKKKKDNSNKNKVEKKDNAEDSRDNTPDRFFAVSSQVGNTTYYQRRTGSSGAELDHVEQFSNNPSQATFDASSVTRRVTFYDGSGVTSQSRLGDGSDVGTRARFEDGSGVRNRARFRDGSGGKRRVRFDDGSGGAYQTRHPDGSGGAYQTRHPDGSGGAYQTRHPDGSGGAYQTRLPDGSGGAYQARLPDGSGGASQARLPDGSGGASQTTHPDSRDTGARAKLRVDSVVPDSDKFGDTSENDSSDSPGHYDEVNLSRLDKAREINRRRKLIKTSPSKKSLLPKYYDRSQSKLSLPNQHGFFSSDMEPGIYETIKNNLERNKRDEAKAINSFFDFSPVQPPMPPVGTKAYDDTVAPNLTTYHGPAPGYDYIPPDYSSSRSSNVNTYSSSRSSNVNTYSSSRSTEPGSSSKQSGYSYEDSAVGGMEPPLPLDELHSDSGSSYDTVKEETNRGFRYIMGAQLDRADRESTSSMEVNTPKHVRSKYVGPIITGATGYMRMARGGYNYIPPLLDHAAEAELCINLPPEIYLDIADRLKHNLDNYYRRDLEPWNSGEDPDSALDSRSTYREFVFVPLQQTVTLNDGCFLKLMMSLRRRIEHCMASPSTKFYNFSLTNPMKYSFLETIKYDSNGLTTNGLCLVYILSILGCDLNLFGLRKFYIPDNHRDLVYSSGKINEYLLTVSGEMIIFRVFESMLVHYYVFDDYLFSYFNGIITLTLKKFDEKRGKRRIADESLSSIYIRFLECIHADKILKLKLP